MRVIAASASSPGVTSPAFTSAAISSESRSSNKAPISALMGSPLAGYTLHSIPFRRNGLDR